MLTNDNRLFIAAAEDPAKLTADGRELCMEARMGNRHGLITGATGTGKTISLQNLAESFSSMGVPVLITDIKGDLAAMCRPGAPQGSIAARIDELRLREKGYANRGFPVCFWDVFGQQGHPLRITVSDLGPALFSRLLELNDIQAGVLNIVFHIADDNGLLLLDFKDLRSMIAWVADNRTQFLAKYGTISSASIGAIQRALLRLEDEGADIFFGEPALDAADLFRNDVDGRGFINVLAADKLMRSPRVYASAMLWLLSELYERLPEAGDLEKPRIVLMFDEAHLLFNGMPAALLEKVNQVIRLIRSKGVGIYFITQSPADIPDTVLSQLGNRIQHALRAFTPKDQKAVRVAADTFRPNPSMDTASVISSLRTGEALVSFLGPKGAPAMVERALILPPEGGIGAITPEERAAILGQSPMGRLYDTAVDRKSAYEVLNEESERRREQLEAELAEKARLKEETAQRKAQLEADRLRRAEEREARLSEKEARMRAKQEQGVMGEILGSAARTATRSVSNTIGREIGKTILRGVLGGIFGGRR